MPEATFHFPRGFLWGTATASHQVEGNNTNNNWWNWEQQPGRIQQGHRSALACDWWGGRWKDDFDRAAACCCCDYLICKFGLLFFHLLLQFLKLLHHA